MVPTTYIGNDNQDIIDSDILHQHSSGVDPHRDSDKSKYAEEQAGHDYGVVALHDGDIAKVPHGDS